MEQISLEKVNENVLGLMKMMEEMKEILIEDEFELADDVIQEIEESRKKPDSELIPFEDIEAEFNEN